VLPVVNGQVPILQSEFKSFLLILRTNKWLFGGNSASETGIMERATNCGSGRLRWDLFGNIFQSPAPFLFHNVLETSVITFGKFFGAAGAWAIFNRARSRMSFYDAVDGSWNKI
jgi:hypothetical protein